jgi:hypothetical protein
LKGKSAAKSAGEPALIPQPHGGALYAHGVPGNQGNPTKIGRPPSALRALAGKHFEELIPELRRIGQDGEREGDRVKAIVAFGQFSIGSAKGVDRDVVLEVLRDLAQVVQRHVLDEAVLKEIHKDWNQVMRERLAAR